jgi:hypothetical protein
MARHDLITEAKAHVYGFTLWPRLWDVFDNTLNFSWSKKLFAKSVLNEIPQKSGVYTFVIEPHIADHPSCAFLVYAGRTKNLRERFKQYIEVQERRRRHSPKVEFGLSQYLGYRYLFFYYSFHDEKILEQYEQGLLNGFAPPWNDKKTISSEVGVIMRAF